MESASCVALICYKWLYPIWYKRYDHERIYFFSCLFYGTKMKYLEGLFYYNDQLKKTFQACLSVCLILLSSTYTPYRGERPWKPIESDRFFDHFLSKASFWKIVIWTTVAWYRAFNGEPWPSTSFSFLLYFLAQKVCKYGNMSYEAVEKMAQCKAANLICKEE